MLDYAAQSTNNHLSRSLPININNLEKRYGEVQALNGISLSVQPGEMISLIGRSGAGKTTLLRCLNGLIKPTGGQIVVGDQEITSLKGKSLRDYQKTVGMIFQQFNLVKRINVLNNVLIGGLPFKKGLDFWLAALNCFKREELHEAFYHLKQVGISEHAWQRTDNLSGGQQQRVAIAKILFQSPRLILADEPIASLDPYSSETVMEILQEINQKFGTTIIINMHYLNYAKRYSSRIIGLKRGRIVFDGPSSQLTEPVEELIYGEGYAEEFTLKKVLPISELASDIQQYAMR